MFNGLHTRRAEIEENWRSCLAAITDTSEYEAELERVETACAELQTLMKNALLERGKNLNADDATSRYEAYQERLAEQARIKEELEGKISVHASKRIQAERYLSELTGRDGPLTEFDPLAWQAVVHHASMSADGILTFFLRDGTTEKTNVESGVRQYRKRAKPAKEASV